MALIPEDRKTEGLMLPMSVRDNLSFAALDRLSRWRHHRPRRPKRDAVDEMVQLLAITHRRHRHAGRRAVRRQPAEGGHRQMADDGSRASSCSTIRRAASTSAPSRRSTSCCASWPTRGAAILFYSTDYDELIGCCDRVLVMYDGAIKRELVGAEITERALIGSALNIGDDARRRRGAGGRQHEATGATGCASSAARCWRSRSSS